MGESGLIEPIVRSVWSLIVLAEPGPHSESCVDSVFDAMAVQIMRGSQSANGCLYDHRRLIQVPGDLKALLLDRMSIVVLEHAAGIVAGRGDHDITETNIVSCRHTATDADHQDNSDVGESSYHVLCNRRGVYEPGLPMWHDRNNNIVQPDAAQGVIIVIMESRCADRVMLLIKECLGRDGFDSAQRRSSRSCRPYVQTWVSSEDKEK